MDRGMAMSVKPQRLRNYGPEWGFRFLQEVQRVPRWILRPVAMLGTWLFVASMTPQRVHSLAYLTLMLGRPAGLIDVWRHFFAYLESLMLRLRVAGGASARCAVDPACGEEFEALIASQEPALFGTFHFGNSDLLGFLLGRRGRRVAMIRLKVDNSEDTAMLERQFAGAVAFIWVNEPESLLFAIKTAIERGDSLAMQCDRFQYSAKTEVFDFLGARRVFPFTIYHLALMFERPVIFCMGLPDGEGGTRVVSSPLFRRDPQRSREENFARARAHFQAVLTMMENLMREFPYLWFNFLPMNPEAGSAAARVGRS